MGDAVEPEGTMLSAMFASNRPVLPTRTDVLGRVFLDRDGVRFGVLLNYLRGGSITGVSRAALDGLREEAAFFGMRRLEKELQSEISARQLEEEMDAMDAFPGSQGSVVSCESAEEGNNGVARVAGCELLLRKEGADGPAGPPPVMRSPLDYSFSLTEDF